MLHLATSLAQPNVQAKDLIATHSERNLFVQADGMAHYVELIHIDVPRETIGSPPFLEGRPYIHVR